MGALPKTAIDEPYTPLTGRAYVGQTLGGKYQVTRVIGVGGMGVVCVARHLQLGSKRFAVKLVQRYFAGSELAAARFRREVRAIAAIESEHIVQVTDVGVDDQFGLYMVMELMQGEDLASYIHRSGPLKAHEAVRIAHQIAKGLAKAHAARILHRDLKPANVFLVKRENGSLDVKIFDFGISKLLGDPEATGTWNAELTGVGMPVGTPQYMSPEQAQGMETLDPRTDVWSLGAVLFEMLSGRSPYEPRGRAHQTIIRVMTEDPPRLETIAPWVPPPICRIVNAALTRDRDKRIPSCDAFADLLDEAQPTTIHQDPSRPRIDDEVTVVAPRMDTPPGARPTPLPAPAGAPNARFAPPHESHTRLMQLAPTVASLPRAEPPKARAPSRMRGIGLFFLGFAVAAAVVVSAHGARVAHRRLSYAVAPAPAHPAGALRTTRAR